MSRGRRRASAAILVLALLVAGCSDSEPEKEASPEQSTGEEVAASIGCEEVDVDDLDDPVPGFQTSFVCLDDDRRLHTQVHTFDERTGARSSGASRSPSSRARSCPSAGSVPTGRS